MSSLSESLQLVPEDAGAEGRQSSHDVRVDAVVMGIVGETPHLAAHLPDDILVGGVFRIRTIDQIVQFQRIVFQIVQLVIVKGVEDIFPPAVKDRPLDAVDLVAVGLGVPAPGAPIMIRFIIFFPPKISAGRY